jgi:SMC interacting uncharacterized protein involved in chromosome segregation
LLISVIIFISSALQTLGKIKKVNEEVAEKEEKLAELKKKEDELKKKYEEITSDEYMEKQLRNQLNLSKENEIVLVLPPDEILMKLVPPDKVEEQVDLTPNWKKWAELFRILK